MTAALNSLFIVDMSVVICMLVLADLSKRLGEALKIPPYYRVLYITAAAVFCSFGTDSLRDTFNIPVFDIVTMAVRGLAGITALAACLPYWRWLLIEFFLNQR